MHINLLEATFLHITQNWKNKECNLKWYEIKFFIAVWYFFKSVHLISNFTFAIANEPFILQLTKYKDLFFLKEYKV